jgi:large subunit ribosomal protein L25
VNPKAIHYHPVTDEPLHFDLYRVEENALIDVEVPVRFLNQDICPGLKKGGALNIVRHTVSLKVLAGNIPEEIKIDLANADIGDVVHVSNITLPAGAKPTIQDRDFTIATIIGRGGKQDQDDGGQGAAG